MPVENINIRKDFWLVPIQSIKNDQTSKGLPRGAVPFKNINIQTFCLALLKNKK